LLAAFGDGSGLPVMRKDYERLTKTIEKRRSDPNAPEDPNDHVIGVNRRAMDPLDALEVGRVLAMVGDNRGFDLATRTLLDPGNGYSREKALRVLFAIYRWSDKSTLASEKRDPEPTIMMLVESETDPYVLRSLVSQTVYMTGEKRKYILDKVIMSPHGTDEIREIARTFRKSCDLEEERNKRAEETAKGQDK
jgi:hypothetical protein